MPLFQVLITFLFLTVVGASALFIAMHWKERSFHKPRESRKPPESVADQLLHPRFPKARITKE
jgi:hypothetical protein